MLNGYLALNLAIPFYILYSHYAGRSAAKKKYLPWMYISAMWAVSIHLVTAFLLAGLPSRPFWNTALMGPRFLASAFTAGPAFVILLLYFIRRTTRYEIAEGAFSKLALITVAALAWPKLRRARPETRQGLPTTAAPFLSCNGDGLCGKSHRVVVNPTMTSLSHESSPSWAGTLP